jgi:hypothetical protein
MKKIIFPLIVLSFCFNAKSQDTSLSKAAVSVCDCLTKSKIEEKSSPEQMQQVFLNCMFTSAPDLISKIVSSGEDYQKAGEEIGTKLAMEMMKNGCPAFTKIASAMAMSGGDDAADSLLSNPTNSSAEETQSIQGTVTKVEERDFTYITIKTTAGREQTFIYYRYVPGSDEWIKDAVTKLKNKNVSLSYVESEVYQPKFKQFMHVKEIKTLTLK